VQDGRRELVQLVHAACSLQCHAFAHVPVEVVEGCVQDVPQAPPRAELHDQALLALVHTRAQEQD